MFNVTGVLSLLATLLHSCASSDTARTPPALQQREHCISEADSLLKIGNADSAWALYAFVAAYEPSDLQSLIGLGKSALEMRQWSDALRIARRIEKIDYGNLSGHYIAAIADREQGTEMLGGNVAWKRSHEEFDMILAQDSLFQDALYQEAILAQYEGKPDEALNLARLQIAMKPDLLGPQLGMYGIYRHYLASQDSDQVLKRLRIQSGEILAYSIGEKMRRNGDLAGADSIFSALLIRPGDVPLPAIYLSRSRLRFAQGDQEGAETEYWKAIRTLDSKLGAALLFEDLKYIVSDAELYQFRNLDSINLQREFFLSFWNFRNPSIALGSNLRLREHIRRYTYAERHFEFLGFRTRFNDPDLLHELKFPRAIGLNRELNDKGLIFMRHGEPTDIIRFTPEESEEAAKLLNSRYRDLQFPKSIKGVPDRRKQRGIKMDDWDDVRAREALALQSALLDPCESWLYNATSESPRMVFYFQEHNSVGNNWRLSPSPSYELMIEELRLWDVKFEHLFTGNEADRVQAEDQIKSESKTVVNHALSTENLTWEKKTQIFRFPYSIDIFRAPGDKCLLDVSYGIPLAPLSHSLPDTVQSLHLEVGFSLVDSRSHHEATQLDTLQVSLSHSRTGIILDMIRYTVPPDSYAVSMHLRPLMTDKMGTWRQTIRAKDFSRPGFMISSIQLLRPSTEKGALDIGGMKVIQSPLSTHLRTEPLLVYFQLYHLVADADGATSYRTECILQPRDDPDQAKGIPVYTEDKMGTEEMAAQFCQIDVKLVPPGHYRLIVTATDRKRVQTICGARDIEILKP